MPAVEPERTGHDLHDLTLLTAAAIPWVQDGDRNSDGVRQRIQRRFDEELRERPEPVVELRGTLEQRLSTAVDAIDLHLGIRPPEPGSHHQQGGQP